MGDPMAFLLSGVVVNSYTQTMHADMDPDPSPTHMHEKRAKLEIKREKNRESSAKSRQRKKDEDDMNAKEVSRLEKDNERLRKIIAAQEEEGRMLLDQVDPFYFDNPPCAGCVPRDQGTAARNNSAATSSPQLPRSSLAGVSLNEQPPDQDPVIPCVQPEDGQRVFETTSSGDRMQCP